MLSRVGRRFLACRIHTQVNTGYSSTGLTLSATVEWEHDSENTPVYAVVSAIAEASGIDVTELPPLYEAINPEALSKLFTARSEPPVSQVSFEYAGYDVVVHGSGVVQVQTTVNA